MPQKTLTDKLLRNLKAKDKDRVEYSDSVIANDGSLPGSLIVRVSKSGRKTCKRLEYQVFMAACDGRKLKFRNFLKDEFDEPFKTKEANKSKRKA